MKNYPIFSVLLVTIALSFGACLSSYSRSKAPVLDKFGVITGTDLLKKTLLSQTNPLGYITDIQADPNSDIVAIAGTKGAAVMDKTGNTRSTVTFDKQAERVSLVLDGK